MMTSDVRVVADSHELERSNRGSVPDRHVAANLEDALRSRGQMRDPRSGRQAKAVSGCECIRPQIRDLLAVSQSDNKHFGTSRSTRVDAALTNGQNLGVVGSAAE